MLALGGKRRNDRRYADEPHTTAEISGEQLEAWVAVFEKPGESELRGFD